MEKDLLSIIKTSREAYEEVEPYIKDEDLSDLGLIIYKEFVAYYNNDADANSIDIDIILQRLERQNPKHIKLYQNVLNSLRDISVPNAKQNYIEHRLTILSAQIATLFMDNDHKKAAPLLEEYAFLQDGILKEDIGDSSIAVNKSIKDVVKSVSGDNLIPLFPATLNNSLDGGVVKGSHIIVFARPDGGKTIFAIHNTAAWLRRGFRVLYIGNEDPEDQMLIRFITRLAGMTKYDIIADTDKAEVLAGQAGYGNLIFASLAPGSPREIDKLIEEYNPDMVVIDQLRNLNVGQDNKVLQLEQAAIYGRSIGKRYGATVMSVTQAGDSADNKLVLGMGDVDFSNTGIPSQADVMIGLGTDENFRDAHQVMMSVCKNKANGFYGHFSCNVDKSLNKISS